MKIRSRNGGDWLLHSKFTIKSSSTVLQIPFETYGKCFALSKLPVAIWCVVVWVIIIVIDVKMCVTTWASAGGGKGGLLPPGRPRPAKNSMFLDFFCKNSIFCCFLGKKKFLAPPLEKSLRTPMRYGGICVDV
jgi:hypothetical protein